MKKQLGITIAFRYLISKKSTNAINIITLVSVTAITVVSFAMITLFSFFNGFDELVKSLFNKFSPDVQVTLVEGKVFKLEKEVIEALHAIDGVAYVSMILQEKALLRYDNNEYIATIKGVSLNYPKVSGVDSALVRGDYITTDGKSYFGVFGAGVSAALGINLNNTYEPILVYMPDRKSKSSFLNPANAFNREVLYPSGIFTIQQEFDNQFVITDIDFMRDLLEYDNEISALEIKTKDEVDEEITLAAIQNILGDKFKVKNRYQQNETLFKVMQTEKLMVFAVATLILLIAAFNIIGALSMLVIEKKRDISVLKALGATKGFIQKVYLMIGMIIATVGCFVGVLLSIITCYIQQVFGIIKIPGSGSFVIEYYPVDMRLPDFILVIATVIIICLIASWVPARKAAIQTKLILQK